MQRFPVMWRFPATLWFLGTSEKGYYMNRVIKNPSQLLDIKELPPVSNYLSTGCTILDLAIADRLPGGFGAGRISHVIGYESSAKSILALEPLGSAQRQGGFASYIDAEMTLDFQRASDLFGVDVSKLNYMHAGKIEDLTIGYFFDEILPVLEKEASTTKKPSVCSIDSLSAITTELELEEATDKMSYGTRAKSLSKGFRKHIWKLSKANLGLIFIDQTRQNVGVLFGKKHVVSGGEALKFYATTRLFVKKVSDIKNKHDKIIGINVHFKVEKNKLAPPYREGEFSLLFDYGIDDIATNLIWLKTNLGLKGKYQIGNDSFKSLDAAIAYIEDNELEAELQNEVYQLWQDIYTKVERKGRIR